MQMNKRQLTCLSPCWLRMQHTPALLHPSHLWLMQGVSIYQLSSNVGTSIEMIENYYGHLHRDQRAAAEPLAPTARSRKPVADRSALTATTTMLARPMLWLPGRPPRVPAPSKQRARARAPARTGAHLQTDAPLHSVQSQTGFEAARRSRTRSAL